MGGKWIPTQTLFKGVIRKTLAPNKTEPSSIPILTNSVFSKLIQEKMKRENQDKGEINDTNPCIFSNLFFEKQHQSLTPTSLMFPSLFIKNSPKSADCKNPKAK